MNTISVLIKPASSACNLKCRYCFYEDESKNRTVPSHPVMTMETAFILGQRIDEALDHQGTANISFQGGEPTAAGLAFFQSFVKVFSQYPQIHVNYSIQTNATMVDDAFASFFAEHHFLAGVSLDGYQTNMDAFRYDAAKRSVYFQVLKGIDCLRKAHVDFNILTVVTRDLAEHPEALCRFYLDHHFEYVQLIPCLPGMNEAEDSFSLTPELYASFYIGFFYAWEKALRQGKTFSVNLFENLAGMLAGEPPYQCGMLGHCIVQYVIESNGDVYPCDFYCLDEYCLGNLQNCSFAQLSSSQPAAAFLAGTKCTRKPCENCPVRQFCNGGCRRQNVCYLTEDYCGYQKVMLTILPELQKIMNRR